LNPPELLEKTIVPEHDLLKNWNVPAAANPLRSYFLSCQVKMMGLATKMDE